MNALGHSPGVQLFKHTIFYRHIAPLEQRGIVFRNMDFTLLQRGLTDNCPNFGKIKNCPEHVARNEMESGYTEREMNVYDPSDRTARNN